MAVGRASVVRKVGSVADAAGSAIIIAADSVPVGYQLGITDVQFSVVTNKDVLYLESPSGTPIMAWSVENAIDAKPHCINRHYNTPIVIDGLAAAVTYRGVVWGSAGGGPVAYAGFIGELVDFDHHTARLYGTATLPAGGGWQVIGAAYTVPTSRKLSITDIDFSARQTGAAVGQPYVLAILVNGLPVYYVELMTPGIQMVSLECPIEATAGQVVQMTTNSAIDANPDTAWAQWVGQLI